MTLGEWFWRSFKYLGEGIHNVKEGKCIHCGKLTSDEHKFSDDPDDEVGYLDWCCDGCYENLQESL